MTPSPEEQRRINALHEFLVAVLEDLGRINSTPWAHVLLPTSTKVH